MSRDHHDEESPVLYNSVDTGVPQIHCVGLYFPCVAHVGRTVNENLPFYLERQLSNRNAELNYSRCGSALTRCSAPGSSQTQFRFKSIICFGTALLLLINTNIFRQQPLMLQNCLWKSNPNRQQEEMHFVRSFSIPATKCPEQHVRFYVFNNLSTICIKPMFNKYFWTKTDFIQGVFIKETFMSTVQVISMWRFSVVQFIIISKITFVGIRI